jgi:hypothetical protein
MFGGRARAPGTPLLHRQKFLGSKCCSKKDLVIAKQGVARSEIRALSGAGIEDLSHWKPGWVMAKS